MKRRHNISYTGVDSEKRIDCLTQIRKEEQPEESTFVSVDDLSVVGHRDTTADMLANGKPLDTTKFVDIGEIDFHR